MDNVSMITESIFENGSSNLNNDATVTTYVETVQQPLLQTQPGQYYNAYQNSSTETNCDEVNMEKMDAILDREKGSVRTDPWNKINDFTKINLLSDFATKYGETHALSSIEIAALKRVFITGIERNKLKRVKEVDYDKTAQIVRSVPILAFNTIDRTFTLRNIDPSRVSTLKSLTPKRAATLKNPIPAPVLPDAV